MKNNSLLTGVLGGVLGALILILILNPGNFKPIKEESAHINVTAIDVTDVVEEVNPAVVSIVATKDVPIIEQYFIDPFGGNSPFSFQIPQYRQNGTERQEVGGGSGFLISTDGTLVTNAHVVADTEAEYTVFLNDGREFQADILATDKVLDIAVLQIEADDLDYLEFADSDSLKLGQGVIAIGNALGEFRNTVSTGVISGLSRSITASDGAGQSERLTNVIQTDAAINPGNSGGPLLDFSGTVVGVNTAVSSAAENIGFALPANAVEATVDSILEHGRVIRPYLGVRYTMITPAIKEQNMLKVDQGALILRGSTAEELAVMPGSPADEAGLEENDIILSIDGVGLTIENDLATVIRTHQVGDELKLKVYRDGEEIEMMIRLQEIPE